MSGINSDLKLNEDNSSKNISLIKSINKTKKRLSQMNDINYDSNEDDVMSHDGDDNGGDDNSQFTTVTSKNNKRWKSQNDLRGKGREKNKQLNIATANRFNPIGNTNTNMNTDKKHETRWCPPITVQGFTHTELNALFKTLKITKYRIKLTSIGIRSQCEVQDDHTKLMNKLKELNAKYYTYQLKDDKLLKFVITGLPKIENEDIKQSLIEKGLDIVDIKQINIINKRYDDHNIYVASFKNKSININQLRQIKYLFHVTIQWEHLRRRRSGPPICNICQLYGHAPANCNMNPRCKYCAENHLWKNCTKFYKVEEPANEPICCNCGGKHFSSSMNCPKRDEYIRLQHYLNKKNWNNNPSRRLYATTKTNSSVNNRLIINPRTLNKEFPSLPQPSTTFEFYPKRNNNEPFGGEISNDTNKTTNITNTTPNQNNDLFSFEEITSIFSEVVTGLSKCKSRVDQFNFITHLAIKYVYESK